MGDGQVNEPCDKVISALIERESRICQGSGMLLKPEIARIVADSICYGRGERHLLHAWCVVSNHVHMVTTPCPPYTLLKLMQSIKGYSAHSINKLSGTTGTIWERESFDHMIRSVDQFDAFCRYVEQNPVTAGLCARPEEWRYSSAFKDGERDVLSDWTDQRKTPFVPIRSRGELPHLEKDGATYFVTFRLYDAVRSDGERRS